MTAMTTKYWAFDKPAVSGLEDHDIFETRKDLKNKRIALVITGGIAAIKAPFIVRVLRSYGANVVVYASQNALKFTTTDALEWSSTNKVVTGLTSASEHLSDNNPFDAYLVAPATANIINKMAYGIADDPISTTLSSAIGRMEEGKTKILIAPTMHHTLHTSILTSSMLKLRNLGVRIIPPRTQNGKHNIPSRAVLVSEVCRAVSDSPLKGKRILVTGGPTPVPIDNVRRITNKFRGKLGIQILEELYLRGAEVLLIHGDGAYRPPEHLPFIIAKTYYEYLGYVEGELDRGKYDAGIFSAGVSDYFVENTQEGKIPSGQNLTLNLKPTLKVIDRVRKKHPELLMVSFKYQENMELSKLIDIARDRILNSGHSAVVANRGEDIYTNHHQAYLVDKENVKGMVGKSDIASCIADYLEEHL